MLKIARFAAVVLFSAIAMQTVARAQDEDKVTISANLVSVNISVTDSRGRHVEGLAAEHFEVFDDGVRQRITFFSTGDAPFSLGIVYDMHPTTRERATAVLGALRRFAGSLRRDDDFFMLVFNERGSAAVEFIPTAEQIGEHLAFIPPREPNSLYDAVYLAAEKLRTRPRAKKALLIISDGLDHGSRHNYKELRRRVSEFDVQLYGIGINEPEAGPPTAADRWTFEDLTGRSGRRTLFEEADVALRQAALDELARTSGGASFTAQAESERELFRICEQIALEMRWQYTVGFYPTGSVGKTRWRKLRVRLTAPDGTGRLRLSYREGYRARQN